MPNPPPALEYGLMDLHELETAYEKCMRSSRPVRSEAEAFCRILRRCRSDWQYLRNKTEDGMASTGLWLIDLSTSVLELIEANPQPEPDGSVTWQDVIGGIKRHRAIVEEALEPSRMKLPTPEAAA